MEDKTFNLLEKLYIEMQGLRSEMTDLRSDVTDLRSDVTELRSDVTDIRSEMATKLDLTRMEYENAQKFGVLFDGLSANTEAIQELRSDIQALKKEVENHEIKLKLVK